MYAIRLLGWSAILASSLIMGRNAGAQDGCDSNNVCAARHTCRALEALIVEQRRVDIEFVSGYAYTDSRGLNTFEPACAPEEDSESWRVLAKDGEVCELKYVCLSNRPAHDAGP